MINRTYGGHILRIAIGILALVLVMVGGAEATKFINDNATGGDCISIGIWDAANKTCTLTTNLAETVQIDNDGITLSGNGHIIMGNGTGSGVYLFGRSGVTIKSLTVKNFTDGIYYKNYPPNSSFGNTLIDNIVNSNYRNGIYFSYSGGRNNLTNNTANFNRGNGIVLEEGSANSTLLYNNASYNNNTGIELYHSSNIMLIGNNASNNVGSGVYAYQSSTNTLKNNILNSNYDGIILRSCSGCTLINNIANSNYGDGIFIYYSSSENNLTNNTASLNGGNGIVLGDADSNNTLLGNNASNNNNSGIYVAYSLDNNMLLGNNVSNNYDGISLSRSRNVTMVGNTVSNNYYGIYLYSSINNVIYNNIFNNTNNALDNPDTWTISHTTWNTTKTAGTNIIGGAWLGGNYWSDYAGEDLDGDGLGDTLFPYNSSGNITNGGDFLPLTIPTKPTAGSISGFKFNDSNGNGTWDPTEYGLPNWTIVLTKPDGSTVTTITDADGFYSFTNLIAGNYTVGEVQQGWKQTAPSTGTYNVTMMSAGENITDKNFGNFLPPPPLPPPTEEFISDKSTYIQGELVTFTIINNGTDTIDLPNSAPWWVENAKTGERIFTPVAAEVITPLNPGQSKSWTWNQDDNEGKQVSPGTYRGGIKSSIGESYTQEFEILPASTPTIGSISGNVINVATGMGIPNVTIRLVIVGMGVDTKSIRMETMTDSMGKWMFENLPAGRYIIIEQLPKGFIPLEPSVMNLMLAKGQNSTDNNFKINPI